MSRAFSFFLVVFLFQKGFAEEKKHKEIEEFHLKKVEEFKSEGKPYYLDYFKVYINFFTNCENCQHGDSDEIFQVLKNNGYINISKRSEMGNCYGVCLEVLRKILNGSVDITKPCELIFKNCEFNSELKKRAHYNQFYQPDNFIKNQYHILFRPEYTKDYFNLTFISSPVCSHMITFEEKKPDSGDIYDILLDHDQKIILMGFKTKTSRHSVLIIVSNGQFILFDPNLGFFKFSDLKTLSYCIYNMTKDPSSIFIAAFDIKII